LDRHELKMHQDSHHLGQMRLGDLLEKVESIKQPVDGAIVILLSASTDAVDEDSTATLALDFYNDEDNELSQFAEKFNHFIDVFLGKTFL
jgi:hypothetical protein